MPTLTEFLSTRPSVDTDDANTLAEARTLCLEHLTNIHRATTGDLDPEVIELWSRETADDLDTLPLTETQLRELTELYDALESASGPDWAQDVRMVLGLETGQRTDPATKSAMVHIHHHGALPIGAAWLPLPNSLIAALMNAGQLVEDDYGVARKSHLKLTDMGISTAGVLVPRCSELPDFEALMTGADVKTLMLTGSRSGVIDGHKGSSRGVVKFIAASA